MHRGYALLLLSINLCAVNAVAQKHWQVDVPFNFSAEGQAFPAGNYDISLDPQNGVMVVCNHRDATKRLQWLAVPSGLDKPAPTLKFNEVDNNYTLNKVTVEQWESPTHPNRPAKNLRVSIDSKSP
jgi:hypothetical protein